MTTDLPLIPARNVVAHFARWAVQLAPLGTPERLPECLAALRVYMNGQWSIDSVRELLTRFTASDPVVRLWTYPLVKQDDPGELPRKEHLHIDPADLVDRVVASLTVEARHAAELYAAPPMDAETVKGLRLTGFNVRMRPAGQKDYVDLGLLAMPSVTPAPAAQEPVLSTADLRGVLSELARRFPRDFTVERRVESHGVEVYYYGPASDGGTQLIFSPYLDETFGWENLNRCGQVLADRREWSVTWELGAVRKVRLEANGKQYIAASPFGQPTTLTELLVKTLLAVPVEVSE